jgi:hypothetical protein
MAPKAALIIGDWELDRMVAVAMLHQERPQAQRPAFNIALPLPLAEVRSGARLREYVRAIAWKRGEMWIRLLGRNPGALLDLPEPEQSALAGLLVWVAGSQNSLRLRLRWNGLAEDAESRMLLRRIQAAGADAPRLEELPRGTFMSWVGLRPPGIDQTYLIANCLKADELCREQASGLLELADDLQQLAIYPKLFLPSRIDKLAAPIERIALTWDQNRLKRILNTRIERASNDNIKTFGQLFGEEPLVGGDLALIERANGSLSCLLALCDAVARQHQELHPDDPYLDETDLNRVLKKDAGAV